jgi:uncharacterized protein (UPF0548 family)
VSGVLTLRGDLTGALDVARGQDQHPPLRWLDDPPAGTHWVRVGTTLRSGIGLAEAAQALLCWDLHRSAGLRIAADGPARVGGTVICGYGISPILTLAPCRVIELIETPQRVGFTYATLPGHPEIGVERFTMSIVGDTVQFDLQAVSRHADWTARLVPSVTSFLQDHVTSSYLKAARRLGPTPDQASQR